MRDDYPEIELLEPVPEWAVWLAQDLNGSWYVYKDKPVPCADRNPTVWEFRNNLCVKVYREDHENPNWKSTLVPLF